MKVKFKKTHPDAKIPVKHYDDDFCYDLYATSCEEIAPNVWKYGLGLAFQIERGYEIIETEYSNVLDRQNVAFHSVVNMKNSPLKFSIDFRPRSSVWKTGMVLSNCVGTVDELFRGEVSAVFYHVMPNMPKYKIGDRVVQCKFGFTLPIEWEEVEELSKTDRNENGYGSTGLK